MSTARVTTMDVLGMLAQPTHLADPYPLYAELRARSPVRLPTGELVFTRYRDVTSVLGDPRFGKPKLPRPPFRTGRVLFRMFLLLDPPEHTRLRRVVAHAFSASSVAAFRPTVTSTARSLLPAELDTLDLVRDFAYPLPLAVIGELLGIPASDRDQVSAWSRTLTASLDGPVPVRLRDVAPAMQSVVRGTSHPVAAVRAAVGIVGYARDRIATAAEEPTSALLEILTRARSDGLLDDDEVVATWIMIAIAGHETTANLIGNATLALIDHPQLLADARDDPGLIDRVVDECLRYDSPVPYTVRVSREDVAVDGTQIARGGSAAVFMAAANRDPAAFPDPDQLDLARPAKPSPLGFGHGIHACIGALLARLETEAALAILLPRLAPDQDRHAVTHRPSVAVRGLATFPVRLTRDDPTASPGC